MLRGGWRNWRGLLAFVIVGGGLGLPWYVNHLAELNVLTQGATSGGIASGNATASAGITPSRYSTSNIGWYVWNLLNHQLLAPLTLFFLVGTGLALWRFARRRDPADLTPELVIGGLVGYLGVTYITLKDPRYSLPDLVYLAVLGTGWIATAPARARRWLTGAFGVVVLANFVAVSFAFGPTLSITLPGAPTPSVAGARVITFYSPNGWLRSGPAKDGDLLGLLRGLKRLRFQEVQFDGGSANIPDFNQNGLGVLSIEAGLPEPPGYDLSALGPRDAFVMRHFPQYGDPQPCQTLSDGSGVYAVVGNPLAGPFASLTFVCPTHHPHVYGANPHAFDIRGAPRRELLAVMRALLRHGITAVQFDPGGLGPIFFQQIGLTRLAALAGLTVPPGYVQTGLGPHSAYFLRHFPATGDPPPCEPFPDGSGLYIVLGNPVIPFDQYRFYCPLPTPHFYSRTSG